MRMHAALLTFFLREVQNSRGVVFGKDLEIVRTDCHCILSMYIRRNYYLLLDGKAGMLS